MLFRSHAGFLGDNDADADAAVAEHIEYNAHTLTLTPIHYYIEGIVGSKLGDFHLIKIRMYENFWHLFFMDLTAIYIHLAMHPDWILE